MKKLLVQWAISTVALMLLPVLFDKITVDSWPTAIVAAVLVGLVNTFVKPLMKLLSLPITLLTLGLFNLVINAICLLIVAGLVPGFAIDGFFTAVLAAIVYSVVTSIAGMVLVPDGD